MTLAQNRKIEFHYDDLNIEKKRKNFFEELMDLQVDAEENEMSDSDEEEEKRGMREEAS